MADDKLAAALGLIRGRSDRKLPVNLPVSNDGVRYLMESAADVPRLLAVVDAALELAGEWSATAVRLDGMADRSAARGGINSSLLSYRAQAHDDNAAALRATITTALLGEDAADGPQSQG